VTDTVYLIRHAEKPDGALAGVAASGDIDPESLIVPGWQRAGALVAFFSGDALAKPDRIYASAPEKVHTTAGKAGSKSQRPLETVSPLAAKIGTSPILTFTKGQEEAIADDLRKRSGTSLVCWQHEAIPQLAASLTGGDLAIPKTWPGDRFDVVWIFERPAGGAWTFRQLPQNLLRGDLSTVIAST
jgi:hypothetical protein